MTNTEIPILFSCSGCSHAGQLANDVAQEIDRRGIAEMSCLAGIGAAKKIFLNKLKRREVWVIDGCPIHCGLGIFEQQNKNIDVHVRLQDHGIKKNAEPPLGDHFDCLVNEVVEQCIHGPLTQTKETEQ